MLNANGKNSVGDKVRGAENNSSFQVLWQTVLNFTQQNFAPCSKVTWMVADLVIPEGGNKGIVAVRAL